MAGVPVSINFYKNDNSGTVAYNISYSSKDSFTIPFINCIPGGKKDLDWTREDCSFIKWNTLADGSGISYYPEDILNPLDNYTTSEGNLNLYAIWGIIPDNSIHFKLGSQLDYDSVNKESNSLYFITDSGASKIYKGEILLATLNDDYSVNNTNNDIVVNLDNGVLSAELGESIIADIEDLSSEWGEIPVFYTGPIPILNNETSYRHYWVRGDNLDDVFKYNDNEYYYIDQSERELHDDWDIHFTQKWILGSNLLPIQHVLYTGNIEDLEPASSSGQ